MNWILRKNKKNYYEDKKGNDYLDLGSNGMVLCPIRDTNPNEAIHIYILNALVLLLMM